MDWVSRGNTLTVLSFVLCSILDMFFTPIQQKGKNHERRGRLSLLIAIFACVAGFLGLCAMALLIAGSKYGLYIPVLSRSLASAGPIPSKHTLLSCSLGPCPWLCLHLVA